MSEETVIEDGLSPEDLARFEAVKSEMSESEPASDSTEEQVVKDDEVAQNDQDPKVEDADNSAADDSADAQSFTFKVKGEDKDYSHDQLEKMLSREETFQQKWEKHRNSEQYKLGLVMDAAKAGDASAKKQLLSLLDESGVDFDELRESKEEFDVNKRMEADEVDSIFADVKSDVDYEETLGKIDSDLRGRMPEKVFEEYNSNPQTKRVMYDLVRSGRTEEVFGALNEELSKLPLTDRVRYKQDPELYGALVFEVVQDLNAQKPASEPTEPTSTAVDAVSSGNRSHRQDTKDAEPDWDSMSKEEFAKLQKRVMQKGTL